MARFGCPAILRALLRVGFVILFGSAIAARAVADELALPLRFDFKPAVAGYATEYVGVDANATFSANVDHGFEPSAVDSRWGGKPCDDVVDRDDPDRMLLRGAVRVAGGTRFAVRLAPLTRVRVRAIVSSVPFWYSPGTTHYQLEGSRIDDVSLTVTKGASGSATVAGDIDLRTPISKGSLTTEVGSYRKVWFTGKSGTDGVLRIGFFGPAGKSIPISAIEIYPHSNPPIGYRRIGGSFLASPSGATIPGLAAMHAHDYNAARTAFESIADPLTRAYAFAFLAGWLDGADDDFSADLAACASALADPSLSSHPRAIELRDRLWDFANAEKHYRLRGFSWSYPLPPEGEGWFNVSDPNVSLVWPLTAKSAEKHFYLAETLFAQACGHTLDPIVALNAGAHPDVDFEASPFAFRSLERIAKIHLGINPTHGLTTAGAPDPGRVAALELAEDLLRDLDVHGFLATEFDGNGELASLAYAARPEVHQHSLEGGLLAHWNGADIPSTALDPSEAWWSDGILAPDPDPTTPPWADAQRRYLRALRRAVDWWIDDAMTDFEFGGGFGDDPELLGLLVLPLAAIEDTGSAGDRDALIGAAQKILASDWIDDGYYGGPFNDVEHTAEFTTYPLSVGLSLRPDEPALLGKCLDVARHLTSPNAGSTPWATPTPSGSLRFASYYFTSIGPPDPSDPQYAAFAADVPLNARAMAPALSFLGAMENPTLESDLLSWLRSWRDVASTQNPTMPLGLVPASIRHADGAFGTNGSWWIAADALSPYSFPNNLSSLVQLYAGFFGAAHDLADEDAHLWLLPSLRLIQNALTLESAIAAGNTPSDLATTGTANWALGQLLAKSEFWKLCAAARPRLATDSYLRSTDDPLVPGTSPYVSDSFLAALDSALKAHDVGYATYLSVPQGPIDIAGGTYGRKGKIGLLTSLDRGARWLANYFPLGTSAVLYTDRAFLFHQASHQTLYGTITGGEFGLGAPDHLCTWSPSGENESPLDIAVVVNDFASGADGASPRLRVLLYNFETASRDVAVRLWHRIPFGQYAMRRGTALTTTDYFANGVFTAQTVTFDERGDRFAFPLPSRTPTLLEFERIGDATPQPGFDVALSAAEEPFVLDQDGEFVVTVIATNFGDATIGADSFSISTKLRRPDGTVLPLDKSGTTQWTGAASLFADALPGFDGYDLPTASLTHTLPLSKTLLDLIAYGCSVEFRFECLAPDTNPDNDTKTLTLDFATLASMMPELAAKEPKGSAKKFEKLLLKKAKKAAKNWP